MWRHATESQNAPEPTKEMLPAILLPYLRWKQWMISSKTLGIWKFGARPWERPVKAKTLKKCSQGNKHYTKFCLYGCTLYPKLFIRLIWTPVVNYFLNWSTALLKITIWKSGKGQNHTEGRPFLRNWESSGEWLKWILNPFMSKNLLVWSRFIRMHQNFLG